MRGSLRAIILTGIPVLLLVSSMSAGAAPSHSNPLGARPAAILSGPAELPRALSSASLAPSLAWSEEFPRSAPGARNLDGLTYDPPDGYTVLFGGGAADGTYWGDTWEFSNGGWTQLHPRVSPPPLDSVTIVYDAADHYVLLFGGYELLGPDFGETWAFHGGQWTQLHPRVSPSPRDNPMLAYDTAEGCVVLFGGDSSAGYLSDTWTFHAGEWRNISASAGSPPSPRQNAGMAYDSHDGYVVLFGGVSGSDSRLGDTWTFSAGKWANLTSGLAEAPSARYAPAFADTGLGDVLFGGGFSTAFATWTFYSDTWLFSGGAWENLTSRLWLSPAPRALVSATGVPPRGNLLLFGGCGDPANVCAGPVADTWTLGVSSTPFTNASLPVGAEPKGVVYDATHHRVYVANYGSANVSVIDASTGRVIASIPTHEYAWQLAYDPVNERLYVANDFTNRLTVIDTQTDSVVGALYAGCAFTVGVVFDPLNGLLYIECDLDSEVAVASPATGHVFKHIGVPHGTGNGGIALDRSNGDLYVANYFGDTVTVISGATNRVVALVTVGPQPDGTLYDPLSGLVYVSLFASSAVALLDPATDRTVGSVDVGSTPEGSVLLAADHLVAVANTGSNNVTLIDAETGAVVATLPGGSGPTGLAYDAAARLLFVTDVNSGTVLELGPL